MIDLSDSPTSSRLVNQLQIYLLCQKPQSEVNASIGTRARNCRLRRKTEGNFPRRGLCIGAFNVAGWPVGGWIGPDQKGYLYPSAGGEPRMVNGLEPGDLPISWNQDGRSIYLYRSGECPPRFTNWN